MPEFQNITFRCIKGIPIDSVQTRTLVEMGFPVDAPKQAERISSSLQNYYWKLDDSPFSVIGRVESEYISGILLGKSREESFAEVLSLLSPYGIFPNELIAGLVSGCVFDLTEQEVRTMLDEFIFIIENLLPRQLSDIYYSFDIEPNPAHGVFFKIAAERLNLSVGVNDQLLENRKPFTYTATGVEKLIRGGQTFLSIYKSTCATKELIKEAYYRYAETIDFDGDAGALLRIESVLFGLSKKYCYEPKAYLGDDFVTFDFVVYEGECPVIAIDYFGETDISICGAPFPCVSAYAELIHQRKSKDRICTAPGIPYLQIDIREAKYARNISSIVREVLKNPKYAKLHRIEREDYFNFGRAAEDSCWNYDAIKKSKLCGCYDCMRTFNAEEVTEWDVEDDSAVCPYCGQSSVIGDSQGYAISEEFMLQLNGFFKNSQYND